MYPNNNVNPDRINGAINQPVIGVASYDNFRMTAMSGQFCTGNASEGWTQRTCSFTYIDDTHITYAKSVTGSRSFYVYGLN